MDDEADDDDDEKKGGFRPSSASTEENGQPSVGAGERSKGRTRSRGRLSQEDTWILVNTGTWSSTESVLSVSCEWCVRGFVVLIKAVCMGGCTARTSGCVSMCVFGGAVGWVRDLRTGTGSQENS